MSPKDTFNQVRRSIEKKIEVAEEERRRKMLAQRLELARTGIAAFQKRQIMQAITAFHSYIRILEELKNVPEGCLQPSLFDPKKDLTELLMISGVYWDLVKLYDRTKTIQKRQEFVHYLEKFIEFSQGTPYQALSAETLRKYIQNEKAMHPEDFRRAYRVLGGTQCFIATSLVDVISPETLPELRRFRDQGLSRMVLGRWFIQGYYRRGPRVADWIDSKPRIVRRILGSLLNGVAFASKAILNG